MTFELQDKVALVTGAGSGIGRAAALRFAAAGADVAVLTRSSDEAAATAESVERLGRRAVALTADIADAADMSRAMTATIDALGAIDVVLASAGINGVWAPLDELTPEEWDETIATNLRGTFLTMRYAIPHLKKRGGSIVIVSSINGTRTFSTAGASAYAVSKAGQLALGQMAALELAPARIRVNVICPGAIDTEIEDNTDRRGATSKEPRAIYPDGQVPLTGGHAGTAEEVAELALFLASDRSRHITGTPVWIDGGQSLLV